MIGFDARQGLVIVRAHIWGPANNIAVRLAVDTGATSTVINEKLLRFIGYDVPAVRGSIHITTGSGVERATVIAVERLVALRPEKRQFQLTAFTPASRD